MREEEGLEIHVIAQVDTMAHKIRGFIEKAARAGVDRVFIGLENISPDSLKDAPRKRSTRSRQDTDVRERKIKLFLHGYFLNPPKSARVSPVQKRFTSRKPASLSHFIWSSKGGRSRSKLMKQPPLLTRGNISA